MADSLWVLPFGKFKGKDIEDVPDSYLRWILGEDWFKEKYSYKMQTVKTELEYRDQFDLNIIEGRDI